MGKSILLRHVLLLATAMSLSLSSVPLAAAGSSDTTVTAFVLKGTSCKNGNADIDVSLTCEENNGGSCRLGDTAQVSGTVTFNTSPPENVHVESNACLFYFSGVKLGCYSVGSIDESLCSYMKGQTDGGCPSSSSDSTFDVDASVVLPSAPRNMGYWYTFNLVNTVYDSSDNSLYDVCTTSVHTTRSSASSSYAFAGLGALTTLLVGAYVGKKRRSLATIDLAKEESIITAASTQQADFVEMIDRGVAV